MANPDHLKLLQQGVDVWNEWRTKEPSFEPDLRGLRLRKAILREANFRQTELNSARLSGADLRKADLCEAKLYWADLSRADLRQANLAVAGLIQTNLSGANLSKATLRKAVLLGARLKSATLTGADLSIASIGRADLTEANLSSADLSGARLTGAKLPGANLRGANLSNANLVNADIRGADLTGCRVYGVSAWNLKVDRQTKQQDLIINPSQRSSITPEPKITVDNIEVAQFVYLLLHNEKIRDVIDTVGRKGVLLLGRFTKGRIAVLERLRDELRKRGFLPIVFNFDKPETKDFTETIRLLAGLSKFVIADVTDPKSVPLELQATVPEIMVPFQIVIEGKERPFAMLQDLWQQHRDRVLEPLYYSSPNALIAALEKNIIRRAEVRFAELLARKAEKMKGEHV
jgi:hypothetical protein